MMRSILLFALVAAAAAAAADKDAFVYHQNQSQTPTNDELLEKLTRLEDRFEKEMNKVDSRKTNQMTKLKEEFEKKMADVQDRIVRLEQENEKLTGDFSAAKEKIASLEGEVETLSGLLLRPLATSINRRHSVRGAAGGAAAANDNGQPMTDAESRAIVTPPPTSCAELAQLGNRITGFHLVLDKESNNRIQTVFCDFALAFNNPDYETTIGYNDIKTAPSVSFYVLRQSPYSSIRTVIPYQVTRLNVGGHMNAATGVFTAPVNGRYHFSFKGTSGSSGVQNWVYLRVNGATIAISWAPLNSYNLPIVATLQLSKGDRVDVYLEGGSISDNNDYFTQFSGFLLEEDLVL